MQYRVISGDSINGAFGGYDAQYRDEGIFDSIEQANRKAEDLVNELGIDFINEEDENLPVYYTCETYKYIYWIYVTEVGSKLDEFKDKQ